MRHLTEASAFSFLMAGSPPLDGFAQMVPNTPPIVAHELQQWKYKDVSCLDQEGSPPDESVPGWSRKG